MSTALLCSPDGIERVQRALRDQNLDGWLLYEFHGVNPIAVQLLGMGKTTRRGFVLIPEKGQPVALIHAIEASSWRHWPFESRTYSSWQEMEAELRELLDGCTRLAMEVSPGAAVPTLDYLPAGMAGLILNLGVEAVSSGDLVSRFHSVWTPEQLQMHRQAAEIVADVAQQAFARAAAAVESGSPTNEGDLSEWIRSQLRSHGLTVNPDCIVAIGRTAADPHYSPEGKGETIAAGDLLLIDLWGAFDGAVFADQTWMGLLSGAVDSRTQEIWNAVRDARDAAVTFLREQFELGGEVRGYEVDQVARALIADRGYGEYFVHRTGHSMDIDLHGSGPNLDNLETRDDRLLVPGIGFSVEPGIYIPDEIGVRSEINVYWGPDGPEVSPRDIQQEIFLLMDV
ncbi:MAG: Xaa-Pro peptidase family protein [bacterium]|nr:aminopeptidase P family protein [Gemmatimonadota bacterium]HIL90810.1 aminopeptidase P family protein [Gemmatimonadota bacterium]